LITEPTSRLPDRPLSPGDAAGPMRAALQEKRKGLKPVPREDPRMQPAQASAQPILGEDLSEEAQQRIRKEFFAAGLEKWLHLLGDRSFASTSLPLSREACVALSRCSGAGSFDDGALERQVDAELARLGWRQAFVKLSTRSPKDSPRILAKASAEFRDRDALALPLNERARLLAELVQRHFCIGSGREAVELLTSSDRVREDLEYALEAPSYDELGLHIVLRRWDGPIPIANEFRGIVWEGQLNAVGQYYHPLVFPELHSQMGAIEADIRATYEELRPTLSSAGFTHCIVDFARLGPGCVKVIEINPFDGVALGCFPASTGLFRWDDDADRGVIKSGPFELRLRTTALAEQELKQKLNTSWRDVICPPAARAVPCLKAVAVGREVEDKRSAAAAC